MLGKTMIRVSQEQMQKIVQHWLESKTLAAFMKDTVVTAVYGRASDGFFEFHLENTNDEGYLSAEDRKTEIIGETA